MHLLADECVDVGSYPLVIGLTTTESPTRKVSLVNSNFKQDRDETDADGEKKKTC